MSRQKGYGSSNDYNEGLMGEIQRLIQPPAEEYKKKPFKRSGKNNDLCDSCNEAGNLICCDFCTASFHLSCHDPPLQEEDIPSGLWNCHMCKMKEKYAKDTEKKIEDKSLNSEENMEVNQEISEDVSHSSFDKLIRAANLLNPKQFELPAEMAEQFPFPGSERIEPMKNGRRVKTGNKRIVELDAYGCVPIPTKLCFTCNKTCKKAPLIACDYCPLYFHQDCLEPPMTHLPSGLWMCPNHFQNFTDMNLVKSLSATERLKYWDQFGKDPIDHEVVKLQFFRKVHMKNPPFRIKLKSHSIDDIEIPEIVKYYYENPPSLLPSLKQVMRADMLKKQGTVQVEYPKEMQILDEELEKIDLARKKLKRIFEDQSDIHGLFLESENDEKMEYECEKANKSPKKGKKKSDGFEKVNICDKKSNNEMIDDTKIDIKMEIFENNENSFLTSSETQEINKQLENLSLETIRLLAFQRLQQIVNENPNNIHKFQDKSTASSAIIEIAKYDIQRFPIPHTNSDNKIFHQKSDRPFHIRNEKEKASSIALSLEYPLHRSKVQSRAVLTFVNDYLSGKIWYTIAPSMNQSVFMRYRSFNIGVGANNHLDLARFGNCSFASPKHAVIFFDDITKQFELINYSEYGTEVNGQLYSCDFSEHKDEVDEDPANLLKNKPIKIQSKIKNILDAKKKIRMGIDKTVNDDEVMAAEELIICQCKSRHTLNVGWEGSALLQHGYLIKFGCLKFVFSIVNDQIEIEP